MCAERLHCLVIVHSGHFSLGYNMIGPNGAKETADAVMFNISLTSLE